MKSIHSEQELKTILEMVNDGPLSAEQYSRLEKALEWLNDPRRGYNIIDTPESLAFWLRDREYFVTNFAGGLGLSMRHGGGCYGYLSDELAARWESGWRPIERHTLVNG